jgi:hypothetical protein
MSLRPPSSLQPSINCEKSHDKAYIQLVYVYMEGIHVLEFP